MSFSQRERVNLQHKRDGVDRNMKMVYEFSDHRFVFWIRLSTNVFAAPSLYFLTLHLFHTWKVGNVCGYQYVCV